MKKEIKNISHSIKDRLLNISRKDKINFERILLYYFHECVLKRLSVSKYKDRFILKGGALLMSLEVSKGRPTKDMDFLAQKISSQSEHLIQTMKEILSLDTQDGVLFDMDSLSAEPIRIDADYDAVRIKLKAYLGSALGRLQFDVAFGDAVFPEPVHMDYPSILDESSTKVRAYSWETVIAEKFEAMVKLNFLSSRLKDFFDIRFLSKKIPFEGEVLQEAILKTLKKRDITLMETDIVFSKEFIDDGAKALEWKAFLLKSDMQNQMIEGEFPEVMKKITYFIKPIIDTSKDDDEFIKNWDPKKERWQ